MLVLAGQVATALRTCTLQMHVTPSHRIRYWLYMPRPHLASWTVVSPLPQIYRLIYGVSLNDR